jgi:ppGpp synthetase/RelA/SpoT-type nucleotidyltranferase
MARKAKNKPTADLRVLEQQYLERSQVAERFSEEVAHQLDSIIERSAISLSFPVQRRVKSWASIVEKLERSGLVLKSIGELQDLIGFRIILQFRRDVEVVCGLLATQFSVIDRYDTGDRLKEDQFGYSSVHFVVEIPSTWLAVPSFATLAGLKAEIQVRTTAQHIWAAASHTLQYKSEAAVPQPVRRAIHRVSALLETVDLEFERVLSERATYKSEVQAASLPADEPLNVEIIERVLDEVWPKENKKPGRESYGLLAEELAYFNVTTTAQLRDLLKKHYESVMKEEAFYVGIGARREPARGRKVQRRRVYFMHCGLTRIALLKEFGKRWDAYQKRAIRGVAFAT